MSKSPETISEVIVCGRSAGRNPPTYASPRPIVVAFDCSTYATGTQHTLLASSFSSASANIAPSLLGARPSISL